MEKICPKHYGTLLTPTNNDCHSHTSNTQQFFHNMHCRVLKCPHALNGCDRYNEVPTYKPRTRTEELLETLDPYMNKIFKIKDISKNLYNNFKLFLRD